MSTQLEAKPENTYGQILKSSLVVGGSSAANIVIGLARAKTMAILLGPAGVGLTGLYSSILDVTSTIAGAGVNSSGVRQIAAAVSTGDGVAVARTTVVLRMLSIGLGIIGAAGLISFSRQVSAFTLGTSRYAGAVSLLSLAVLFKLVSAGQAALIQGMRRIADLARMGVWNALLGSAVSIVVIFLLREKGIVLSIACGAAVSLIISWRYSRKISIHPPQISASELAYDLAGFLKLGIAFMATSLMTIGSAYAIRVIILRKIGLAGAGLYQSAWTIGGLYVGFILQAMSADFYPRLTASAENNAECNRLVNEQAFIGLLLGGPGVMATLTLAPLVMTLLYSAKFGGAVEILRWLCLGTFLQVVSWPLGFLSLAKGRQNIFLFSDLAWTVVYIAFAWLGLRSFGLKGAGIAFFGSYLFHLAMTYLIARSLSGFRWSTENRSVGLIFLSAMAFVFVIVTNLHSVWSETIAIGATLAMAFYSLRVLGGIVPTQHLPLPARLLLMKLKVSGVQVRRAEQI